MEQLIPLFNETKGESIIYLVSHRILDENTNMLHPSIRNLLVHSQSLLCLTLYDHGLSSYPNQSSPIKHCSHVLITLLKTLIVEGYLQRLMLSNGVCFKTHLSHYGGLGYTALFEKVLSQFGGAVAQ